MSKEKQKLLPLVWHTEQRKINDLIPWERNPRQMTKKQATDLQNSLERLNLISIPAIDTENTIVSGHQRMKILQLLGRGEETIDVRMPNRKLTDAELEEANLRENKNTGEWDFDALANLDVDLLRDVGWGDDELASIFEIDMGGGGAGSDEAADNVPDPPKEPVSKLGDLFQLGKHKLLCGDAAKGEDVERLMGGEKADLVLTDPPYGINIVSTKNKKCESGKVGGGSPTKFGKVDGDKIVESTWYRPIIGDDKFFDPTFLLSIGRNQIIFGGNYFASLLPDKACWVVWDKQNTGNFADIEMAWTSFDKGAKLYPYLWNGLCREGERKDELIKRVHPTQKPVGLFVNILKDFSEENQSIFDLFGGSGTTLIACEKINRNCFMMELDPLYIDVIITRWEEYTGEKAVKI